MNSNATRMRRLAFSKLSVPSSHSRVIVPPPKGSKPGLDEDKKDVSQIAQTSDFD